jgi:hypothetical protein
MTTAGQGDGAEECRVRRMRLTTHGSSNCYVLMGNLGSVVVGSAP